MSAQPEITADLSASFHTKDPARSQRNLEIQKKLSKLVTLYRPHLSGFLVLTAYCLVMLLLYLGWQSRMEQPLTAESGIGYGLGILGGTLMLLLLLYPLRKHARFMRNLGPVRYWFRTHMLFGVVGPVCILFHSGFQLGSLNSNVALFCMLLVASSGLVGRYFYTKIHHGLYGHKATQEELQNHSNLLKGTLSKNLQLAPWVLARIDIFENHVSCRSHNLFTSLWSLISLGIRSWSLYLFFRITIFFKPLSIDVEPGAEIQISNKSIISHIGAHLSSIRKVAEFHFYERLFGIWHVVHFPLFLMLVVSGIIHVIAVHMY